MPFRAAARRSMCLPAEVSDANLGDLLHKIAQTDTDEARHFMQGVEYLALRWLDQYWREQFYSGPKGGLRLAARNGKPTKRRGGVGNP